MLLHEAAPAPLCALGTKLVSKQAAPRKPGDQAA